MKREKIVRIALIVFFLMVMAYLIYHLSQRLKSREAGVYTNGAETQGQACLKEQAEANAIEKKEKTKIAAVKKALTEKLAKEGKTAYFLGDIDNLSDTEIAKLFRSEKSRDFNLAIEAYRVFSVNDSYVTGATDGCLEEYLSFSPRTPEQIRDLVDQIESGGVKINLLDKKFGGLEYIVEKDCRKEGKYGGGWLDQLGNPAPKNGFNSPRGVSLEEGEHFIVDEKGIEAIGSAVIKRVSGLKYLNNNGEYGQDYSHPRYIVEWNKGCGEWLGLWLKTKTGFQLKYPTAFGNAKIHVWLPYEHLAEDEKEERQIVDVSSYYSDESWENLESFLGHSSDYSALVIYYQNPIVPCQIINGEAKIVRHAWDDNWDEWESQRKELVKKYKEFNPL